MDPLDSPPSEREVLSWFSESPSYKEVFSLAQNPVGSMQTIIAVSTLYRRVFERFKNSRATCGFTPAQVQDDLRVFGFDYYDKQSDKPIRFFSKFPPPERKTFPGEFGLDPDVIWPMRQIRLDRFIASYIRNSWAHDGTRLSNGIVTIENMMQPGGTPNFRIFLSVKEYVHLIAGALGHFVQHVLGVPDHTLGRLKTPEYGQMVSFFRRFLKDLPTRFPY